jgi:DNA-binding MarR family transcriptional regulator
LTKQSDVLLKLINQYLEDSFNDIVFNTVGKFTYTAQLLGKFNDAILSRHKLSVTRIRILHTIILKGPIKPKDIALILAQSKQNTFNVVRRLLKDGLISQKRDAEDGRSVRVAITQKGLLTVKDSFPIIQAMNKETFKSISEDEVKKLSNLLSAMRKNIHKKMNDISIGKDFEDIV